MKQTYKMIDMKKTNILKIALASLFAASTLSSCDDIFDEEPVNKLTEESIWKEPRLLDSYVENGIEP